MKRILVVFGTRPEAIKMSPLIKELQKKYDLFDVKVCVTAQHRQMLDQVLNVFQIVPDYDLDLMKPGQDLYDITSNVLLKIRPILLDYKPDIVLVHGDTTTAMATGLAAYYQKVPVGHIEAGLRTGNIYSPFPEEINRKLISSIAAYNFCPTDQSLNNLINEGVAANSLFVTGNTVIDALLTARKKIRDSNKLENEIVNNLEKAGYNISNNKLILITGHRRENFGDGFLNICEAVKQVSLLNQNVDIVYPVHLNPNVQKPVLEILSGLKNVYLIPPQEYLSFVYLMIKSYIILTDSGGIQEEAPSLSKPVLVMRETTERPEALLSGAVKLVGTSKKHIIDSINELLVNEKIYSSMATGKNPYGDGNASNKIVNILIKEIL